MGLLIMAAGGIVPVLLLSLLWERVAFRRLMEDIIEAKMASIAAGWATAGIIGGFGMADGGPFAFQAFLIYLIPAAALAFIVGLRANAIRENAEADLAKTFD